MEAIQLVNQFMSFLGVEKKEPTLPMLKEIVEAHQLKVKWETLTKIMDWEKAQQTGNFLPSIDVYIDRITRLGAGGTCWTHAVGLYWLLSQLSYDVHYLYMDSGHLCLRVDLDQPYYVDVGYCAPLFKAYPLYQSFTVENIREVFNYSEEDDKITITRTPARKTIRLRLRELQVLQRH